MFYHHTAAGGSGDLATSVIRFKASVEMSGYMCRGAQDENVGTNADLAGNNACFTKPRQLGTQSPQSARLVGISVAHADRLHSLSGDDSYFRDKTS
jgi:hypothetical protein